MAALQPTFPQVAAHLAAFDARLIPGHADLFAAHDAARLQVDTLEDELRRLKRERGPLRDTGDALHVTAQRDGIVTELFALKGQIVARGMEVAVIEASDARQARGWLDPTMAAAVYPGMAVSAEIATASGPERLQGVIARVEAGISPDISPEFGILVHVTFPALAADETRSRLPHLTPVTLDAERPWAKAQSERWQALKARVGL